MLLTFAVIEKVSEEGFFRINAVFSDSGETEDHQNLGYGDPPFKV